MLASLRDSHAQKSVEYFLNIIASLWNSHAIKKAEYVGQCAPLYVILKEETSEHTVWTLSKCSPSSVILMQWTRLKTF